MTDVELLALFHRPELQRSGDRAGTGVYETRKAIQGLRPEISFDAGYDRENPFQQAGVWQDAGLQVARQLFDPPGMGQTAQNATYVRRMNLSMAVVSQLHLSRHRYLLAVEEYRIARDLAEVNRKLNLSEADAASLPTDRTDEFAQIREKTDSLMARMRYYLAFAEVENAAGRFCDSLGIGQFPANMVSMDARSLTAAIQQSLRQQREILRQSHASLAAAPANAYFPQDSPVTDADAAEPGPKLAPEPESPKPPVPDQNKSATVVNASEVESAERQPVREISVFRDVVTIHSSPGYDAPVKGQGLIGEKYRLLGWAPNGWLKIEMGDGTPGWIPTKYVRPVETASALPADTVPQKSEKKSAASPGQSKTPTAGGGQKVIESKAPPKAPSALRPAAQRQKMLETTARANVRTAPSLQSPVLYIEEKGRTLPIVSSAGEWFKVKTGKGDGWLHRSVIKLFSE
ncbi:MAG: SH3 domain-containing protein [Desulfobacterales bacterium]